MNLLQQIDRSRVTCFEDLPPEIKVWILGYMPDVSCLSSIVHASPAYHRAYLGSRDEILHAMTNHILQKNNIGLLDPWTAIRAPQLGYQVPRRVEIITECLERYAQGRTDDSKSRLTPQDSLAILSLHKKFTILIAKYCKAVFSQNSFTNSSDDNPLPLSHFELHGLHRALWRYEIYSKFFGPSMEAPLDDINMLGIGHLHFTFSEVEIAHSFFGLFPIHEVEELACLQGFAWNYYSNLDSRNENLLVAQGPKELYDVMTTASEKERYTRVAEDGKSGRVIVSMRDALNAYERDVKLGSWQWKGMYDELVSERVPSTGWLWASSRGIQNTDFRLRSRGYVFWDQERLDRWGITERNIVIWPYPRRTGTLRARQA